MVLTEKGFIRPDFHVLLERQVGRAKQLFGEDIDTSSNSVLGKFLRINVYDLENCYELLEDIYYARFPNSARGQSLDRLCAFSGISRDPATAARLTVRFRGRAGAVVPMAFLVAGGEQTFYADRDYYLGTDGTVEGYVRCATAGICGNIEKDTLLRIQNPSADVESVEFLSIADYGQEEETDKALRIRFNKSVAGSGSSTKDALYGAIYRVPLVDGVSIEENDTEEIVNGRPPHSFECYVLAPESQDQLIAEAIFEKKPLGIKTVGQVEVQVFDDGNKPHIIRFSRTKQKNIYIRAEILTNQFFELDGEKQIKDNLLSHVNNLANGEPVYLSGLFGYIHEVHGVVSVGNLQISSNGEDFFAGNILIESHEIARTCAEWIEIEVLG